MGIELSVACGRWNESLTVSHALTQDVLSTASKFICVMLIRRYFVFFNVVVDA